MLTLMLLALVAAPAEPAAGTVEPAKPAERPKLLCRYLETTGSRIAGRRICMPRSEWEKAAYKTSTGAASAIDKVSAVPKLY